MNWLVHISHRDWVVLVLGGVIGLLFNYLPATFGYALRLPRRHFIEGTWQCYYYNFQDGRPTLKHDAFHIRKGFLHELSVRVRTGSGGPTYRGKMTYEKGFYLFELKSELTGWEENVFVRFKNPVPQAEHVILGIGLAKDFHDHASANAVVLSRAKLTEPEIRQIILENTQVDLDGRILRIP